MPRNAPDAVVQTLRKAMARQNMGEGYLEQPECKAVIDRDNAVFKQLVDKLGIKA